MYLVDINHILSWKAIHTRAREAHKSLRKASCAREFALDERLPSPRQMTRIGLGFELVRTVSFNRAG
jgi:hypothetical protein